MPPEYNHPPMSKFAKTVIWLVGLGFCVLAWVHGIIPGIRALFNWIGAL